METRNCPRATSRNPCVDELHPDVMSNSQSEHHRDNSNHDSHVHFQSSQVTSEHELGIVILDKGKDCLEVHLGFLKLLHHYSIEFDINDHLAEEIHADQLQNLHCRFLRAEQNESGSGHRLFLEFHAYKEKLLHETLILTSGDKSLTIRLMARVLGKHQGTPMLKNGVKCIRVDADEESEHSDFTGF